GGGGGGGGGGGERVRFSPVDPARGDVPVPAGGAGQREEGAGGRLVAVGVPLGGADLVEHAAGVEEDAPAARHPDQRQAAPAAVAQEAAPLDHPPRLGPQVGQEPLEVVLQARQFLGVDARPAGTAADAVAPPAQYALP